MCPRPKYTPNGEERAWGRRLARRFGCDARYDDRSFRLSAHGAPEPVLDAAAVKAGGKVVVELIGEVDPANGEAVIAYGWAMAEALADGLSSTDPHRSVSASQERARRVPGTPNAERTAPRGEGGVELGPQRLGFGHRQPAREVLAHVRGRAPVDRVPIGEQRGPVAADARLGDRPHRRGEQPVAQLADECGGVGSPSRRPTTATSIGGRHDALDGREQVRERGRVLAEHRRERRRSTARRAPRRRRRR